MPSKKIEKICQQCHSKFMSRKSSKAKFCSKACLGKTRTGKNNPNWKGGISTNHVHYKNLYRSKHPEKAQVHDITTRAIRKGILVRQPCESCGSKKDIQAHHEDYTKPLEVTWLCRTCHIEHHANDRRVISKDEGNDLDSLINKLPVEKIRKSPLSNHYWAVKFEVPVTVISKLRAA